MTSGMPRAARLMTACGHISDSTKIARSGRQWSRNASVHGLQSIGANWWMAPAGSRSAAIFADVTVTVVRTTPSFSARSFRISGRTAMVSPTLAAWSQTSRPAGRSRPARP